MELIDKATIVTEIERRIALLENNSDEIISMLASGMFVNEYKDLLSFINALEVKVKEVDLEQEVHSQMDLLCNLLSYMEELSNGDSEGIHPLPEKVIEDLQRFARHFFELGFKAKGE